MTSWCVSIYIHVQYMYVPGAMYMYMYMHVHCILPTHFMYILCMEYYSTLKLFKEVKSAHRKTTQPATQIHSTIVTLNNKTTKHTQAKTLQIDIKHARQLNVQS